MPALTWHSATNLILVPVFMELVGEQSRHCLHDNMHLISTPLQVIWGKQDQVGLDLRSERHNITNITKGRNLRCSEKTVCVCVAVWEIILYTHSASLIHGIVIGSVSSTSQPSLYCSRDVMKGTLALPHLAYFVVIFQGFCVPERILCQCPNIYEPGCIHRMCSLYGKSGLYTIFVDAYLMHAPALLSLVPRPDYSYTRP